MSSVCRKCGNSPKDKNVVLARVNPKGEPGIWECSPACGVEFINAPAAVLHAVQQTGEHVVEAAGWLLKKTE